MRKIIILVIATSLVIPGGYMFFEPQLINGQWSTLFGSPVSAAATSTLTTISLTVSGEINLNCSSTAALVPSIAGQTGGAATTSFGCVVTTNNSSGYSLFLVKNQKLIVSGGSDVADQRFDDYTTSTGSFADWNWDTVGAGAEEFGFNVNSCASTTDVNQYFRDNGSTCSTGTIATAWHCWTALPTTTTTVAVLNRNTATPGAGILTVFGLEAQAGGSNNLQQGTYYTTTTASALTNL